MSHGLSLFNAMQMKVIFSFIKEELYNADSAVASENYLFFFFFYVQDAFFYNMSVHHKNNKYVRVSIIDHRLQCSFSKLKHNTCIFLPIPILDRSIFHSFFGRLYLNDLKTNIFNGDKLCSVIIICRAVQPSYLYAHFRIMCLLMSYFD